MIKKLYLILVLYACIVNVYSQNKLPKYEIIDGLKLASQEIESKIDDEFIKIPLEYYGLIIAYMPNQYSTKGSKFFEIKKFDIDLKEEYSSKIKVASNLDLIDYKVEEENLYLLFSKGKSFNVVKFNFLKNKIITSSNVENLNFYPEKIAVNKGVVSLLGDEIPNEKQHKIAFWLTLPVLFTPMLFYKLKYIPAILNIDMNKETISKKEYQMKNYLKTSIYYENAVSNRDADEIDVILGCYIGRQDKKFTLRTLKTGKISKDLFIKTPPKIIIYDSKINYLEDRKKLIIGLYENEDNNGNSNIEGIYNCLLDSVKQHYFKLIPWGKFGSELEFLAEKSADPGLIFNEVIEKEGYKVFFCQIYNSISVYDFATKSNKFLGNVYEGGLLFAIDNKGELIWNNFVEIETHKTMSIFQNKITCVENNQNVYTISFNNGYTIKSTIIDKNKNTIKTKETSISKLKKPVEKNKSALAVGLRLQKPNSLIEIDKNELIKWYDNVYLVFNTTYDKTSGAFDTKKFLSIKSVEVD